MDWDKGVWQACAGCQRGTKWNLWNKFFVLSQFFFDLLNRNISWGLLASWMSRESFDWCSRLHARSYLWRMGSGDKKWQCHILWTFYELSERERAKFWLGFTWKCARLFGTSCFLGHHAKSWPEVIKIHQCHNANTIPSLCASQNSAPDRFPDFKGCFFILARHSTGFSDFSDGHEWPKHMCARVCALFPLSMNG